MQITLPETIIVALLTCAATLGVGWWRFRGELRKSAQEEMAINATARLEFERLMMARLDQQNQLLQANERELASVRLEVATLREENAGLRARVRDLETENATLRAELKRICGERGETLRGVTG